MPGYLLAIFMNPSKAFDAKNHELLLAKLKTYFSFFDNTVQLIHSYLLDQSMKM